MTAVHWLFYCYVELFVCTGMALLMWFIICWNLEKFHPTRVMRNRNHLYFMPSCINIPRFYSLCLTKYVTLFWHLYLQISEISGSSCFIIAEASVVYTFLLAWAVVDFLKRSFEFFIFFFLIFYLEFLKIYCFTKSFLCWYSWSCDQVVFSWSLPDRHPTRSKPPGL